MGKSRKESRQFNISVEGINCEKMYFDHVAELINTSNENKYNAKITCKKTSPGQFAKRIAYRPVEKKRNKKIPYFHVQDIEDYYNLTQQKMFYQLIDEIKQTEKEYGITYQLGYTNFTFELWLLLHVTDMKAPVTDRFSYLRPINRYFHRNYQSLDEYKNERQFLGILTEFIELDNIRAAVKRADAIIQANQTDRKSFENYRAKEVVWSQILPPLMMEAGWPPASIISGSASSHFGVEPQPTMPISASSQSSTPSGR